MHIGFVYAILAAISWGFVYAVYQKVLYTTSPLGLLFANSIFSALIVLPLIFTSKSPVQSLLASGKTNLLIIFGCIALTTFANFMIYSGIQALDASTASIIEIAYPFFVILFSYFIFNTTPNAYLLIGGVLVFMGSVIIIKFG